MSKRELAARALGRPILGWMRTNSKALRVLAYHRVYPQPWQDFPFDEDLISASPEAFERQVAWAKRNFEIISFRDLEACERESRPWPKRALILTFDDGYLDNYLLAYPVLHNHNVPATIFLSTGYIGQSKLFWWDIVAYCLKHTPLESLSFPQISGYPMLMTSALHRRQFIDTILSWAKQVPEEERRQFLEELPEKTQVSLRFDLDQGRHLNWDQVREMSRDGIEFGSHTVTHPILAQVTGAQLERELRDSKTEIEEQTGKPVHVFAYPAGTRARRDEAAEKMVKTCGYTFAVAYDQAVESDPNPYAIPRIHVDRGQSVDLFRANLRFPGLMMRS